MRSGAISSGLEWLNEIFSDTKHHAASLRQLSFLFPRLRGGISAFSEWRLVADAEVVYAEYLLPFKCSFVFFVYVSLRYLPVFMSTNSNRLLKQCWLLWNLFVYFGSSPTEPFLGEIWWGHSVHCPLCCAAVVMVENSSFRYLISIIGRTDTQSPVRSVGNVVLSDHLMRFPAGERCGPSGF